MLHKMICLFALMLIQSTGLCVESEGPKLWNVTTTEELLAAAAEVNKSGGTIKLAPGTYKIAQPIVFKDQNRINIAGTGWDTDIQMTGKGDAFVFDHCSHSTVRDLNISGSKDAGSGIIFRNYSSSNMVDFCRIAAFPISGVRFEGKADGPMSSNVVSRCHFINNAQEQLYSFYNNDFHILQNQFGAHGMISKVGAFLDHSSAGAYSLNCHWENEVAFKLGAHSHYNRIENNRFENSQKEGVILGDPDGWACYFTIFTGNTVHTNSEGDSGKYAAVKAANVSNTTFTSNQIYSWNAKDYKHSSSLVIGPGCKSWIVKDNMFHHNTGKPLVYEEDRGHIVKDNITD